MTLWDDFCKQHKILQTGVPLFEGKGNFIKVKTFGRKNKRKVLQRSKEMEKLIEDEVKKLKTDFENEYEGLIYMMYWTEGNHVIPLYIGKAEKFGKNHNELSANITTTDNSKFCRWSRFCMMFILHLDVFLNNLPSISHRPMEAAWCPHMFTAPFLKMGKFLPDYSACPFFQFFHDKTERIL